MPLTVKEAEVSRGAAAVLRRHRWLQMALQSCPSGERSCPRTHRESWAGLPWDLSAGRAHLVLKGAGHSFLSHLLWSAGLVL